MCVWRGIGWVYTQKTPSLSSSLFLQLYNCEDLGVEFTNRFSSAICISSVVEMSWPMMRNERTKTGADHDLSDELERSDCRIVFFGPA
jgi:hypothetical protein